MKLDPLWLLPIALPVVGLACWMLLGNDSSVFRAAPGKPPCTTAATSTTECIPRELLAKLPPDPGREGKKTIEGIDSDKDGVRDDVQRYIALNWGHSERAVRALSGGAKGVQMQVLTGDSVSRDEAKRLAEKFVMNRVSCFTGSVDEGLRWGNALGDVVERVANTPERARRKHSFEYQAAHQVYMLSDAPITELCGYDPTTLPN